MKRLTPSLALALVLAAGAVARADPTPPSWTYLGTPSPQTVNGSPALSGGANFITLLEPKSATGDSVIVAANISLFGSAATSTFGDSNGSYTLSVNITDTASGDSHVFTFAGKLGGTFSTGSSLVTNDILDTGANPQTQTWTASNGNFYTVTIPDSFYSPPGPANSGGLGAISAYVTVVAGQGGGSGGDDGGGGIAETPEPGTLALSCLGLAFAGAASWRKRRRG
jgi:hypothetical protein